MEKKNKIIFKLFEDFKQDQEQYDNVLNIIKNININKEYSIEGIKNIIDLTPEEKGDSKTFEINIFNSDRKDVIIIDLILYCTYYKYFAGDYENEPDKQYNIESEINEILYFTDYGSNEYIIKITDEIKENISKIIGI